MRELLISTGAAFALMLATTARADSGDRARGVPLRFATHFEFSQDGSSNTLRVTIQNNSKKIACLYDGAFAPIDNGIELWDAFGQPVSPDVEGYYKPKEFRGVEYTTPYDFVFPGGTLEKYVELKAFSLKPGLYEFKWFVPYYVCSDVVDLENETKSSGNPQLSPIPILGHFTVAAQ